MVELVRQIGYKVLEVSELQGAPHFLVSVGVKWVKVHSQRAREQHRILVGVGGQQMLFPKRLSALVKSSQRVTRKIRLMFFFLIRSMTGASGHSLCDKSQAPPSAAAAVVPEE